MDAGPGALAPRSALLTSLAGRIARLYCAAAHTAAAAAAHLGCGPDQGGRRQSDGEGRGGEVGGTAGAGRGRRGS